MSKIAYIWFFLILLLTVSCGNQKSSDQESGNNDFPEGSVVVTHEQFDASGMSLVQLRQTETREKIDVTGELRSLPHARSMVSTVTGGRITELMVSPGDKVKRNEPLFTLEDPSIIELQQEYADACARLPVLKADFERQRNLFRDDVASQKVFEEAKARFLSGEARCSGLKKQLRLLGIDPAQATEARFVSSVEVKAPVNGVVTMMNLKKGAYMEPRKDVMEIVDASEVFLMLKVYEKDIPGVKEGQEVLFRLAARSEDGPCHAKIERIVPEVEEDSRVVSVYAEVPDSLTGLWPGMYVNAEIFKEREQMMALPSESIVEVEGQKWALLKKDESENAYAFEQVRVETRSLEKDMTGILNFEDFSSGDVFLGEGAFALIRE